MQDTVDRKYVFVLSALAVGVLAGGVLLKPKKTVPDPPSPSETASLQAKVRREDLGETGSFFAQRAQVFAQDVVYDSVHDASGVAWEKAGQVLTTRAAGVESYDPPLVVTLGSTGKPPSTRLTELTAGRWLLIVGRTADNQLLWAPALFGGTRQTTCGGGIYKELIVNARLDSALSGAGAFDLEGLLAGVVANCDGAYHLVAANSISELLKAFAASDRRIDTAYGFHVAELSADAKRLFSVEAGLLVKKVRQGDAADLAGLKAGDVIKLVEGQPLSRVEELWSALESEDESSHVFEVLRNRRIMTVRMPSIAEARSTRLAGDSLGIRIAPLIQTWESLYVTPGTPAYRAGLRTGDKLIQVGDKRISAAGDFQRAISGMGDRPLLVVYQRGRAQEAALVSK